MCKNCPLNWDRLLFISIGFLFLFTAANTANGLASKVLSDSDFGELGFYSLGLAYCVFGISSFFSAPIVTKCGDRLSLVLGGLCYVAYMAAFIAPTFRYENPDNQTL
jgi:hypothetical protein